jgi:hypothetical protein
MCKTYNAMKKYISDPRAWLGLGAIFFFIGAIDTWGLGANSWSEMLWWSKTAFVGFMIVLSGLFLKLFLLPVGYWIVKGVKKLFGK